MKHAPYSTRRQHLLSQLGNGIAIIQTRQLVLCENCRTCQQPENGKSHRAQYECDGCKFPDHDG